jgi:hypothetical protein
MPKKKGPFKNYTVDEVMASEAAAFVIQVGSDVFHVNGRWVFNKRSAVVYYNKILRTILDQMHNGTKRERKDAKRVLENFKILPLRLH